MTSNLIKVNERWLLLIGVLFLINVWLFWPVDLYFLNDDLLHIPLTDQNHFFQTNSVRPMHELLVRLDLLLYGKHAYGYHITALLLHFLVCIQLFDVSFLIQANWLKFEKQQAIKASLLAVALFLLYPQNSESYAWILGRTPVLSTVFFLLTLRIFFMNSYKWSTYIIGFICLAATLFTYEQSILMPLLLLWVSLTSKEKNSKQVVYVVMLFIMSATYIIIRKIITKEVVGAYEGSSYLSLNILNLSGNLFRLATRLFLNPASNVAYLFGLIILGLLVTSIFFLFKNEANIKRRAFIFFSAAVLLLFIPVLSLGLSIHSFESGRYLYLPSVFLMMGISIAAVRVYEHNTSYRKACLILFLFVSAYWLSGKVKASQDYKAASAYAKKTNEAVLDHFTVSSDTLHIDTLQLSVHRLPVFRLGFKTGIKWLNNNIDTNKIVVMHVIDANQKDAH